MDKIFEREFLGSFNIEPMPNKCPYCNRWFDLWSYEKIVAHITKCAANTPLELNQKLPSRS